MDQNETTSRLVTCISMIREAQIDNLRSASWLEHALLPRMGVHRHIAESLPDSLIPLGGQGIEPCQAPNQFARYLVHISHLSVTTYLEFGVATGGTFIITTEYLSRFNSSIRATAVDQRIEPPLKEYATINSNLTLIEQRTDSPATAQHVNSTRWDLVLIDADHSEEGCWRDYQVVRDNARNVAFHDMANDICPGVEAVWKRISEVLPARSVHEFTDQYAESLRRNSYRNFGIGIVNLLP